MCKMAEGRGNETSSLGKFAKNHTKYGTTTKSIYTNETYLKHILSKGDTLQGIALKYGVSMEQIKRANNLWTNDSLFLKDYILIPLPHSPLSENYKCITNGAIPGTSSSNQQGEIVTKQDLQTANRLTKSKSHDALGSQVKSEKPSGRSDSGPSASDFLSKFDSSLQLIRSNLQKLEETSEVRMHDFEQDSGPIGRFPEDNSNPLNLLPSKRTAKYGYRSNRSHSSDFEPILDSADSTAEPQLVFKSRKNLNKNKHIKTSIEKLQKQQEDIFEL